MATLSPFVLQALDQLNVVATPLFHPVFAVYVVVFEDRVMALEGAEATPDTKIGLVLLKTALPCKRLVNNPLVAERAAFP